MITEITEHDVTAFLALAERHCSCAWSPGRERSLCDPFRDSRGNSPHCKYEYDRQLRTLAPLLARYWQEHHTQVLDALGVWKPERHTEFLTKLIDVQNELIDAREYIKEHPPEEWERLKAENELLERRECLAWHRND